MRYLICVFIIFFAVNGYCYDEIKEIKEIYYSANELIKKNKIEPKCFMILHQTDNLEPIDCSNKPENYEGVISEFQTFICDKKILKIREITFSSAGDQQNSLEYYFYPSLGTAFVLEEHLTFNCIVDQEEFKTGLCKIERRFYFNKNGKKLKDLKKTYLIESNQKKREIKPHSVMYNDPEIKSEAKQLKIYNHLLKLKLIK